MRPRLPHKIHQIVERIAFDIEFPVWKLAHQRREYGDVVGTHVATIRSRVNRNAVCTGVESDARKFADIGDAERTGIADERNFVDVDTKFGHGVILREATACAVCHLSFAICRLPFAICREASVIFHAFSVSLKRDSRSASSPNSVSSARNRAAAVCDFELSPMWRAMISSFFMLCSQPTNSVTLTE